MLLLFCFFFYLNIINSCPISTYSSDFILTFASICFFCFFFILSLLSSAFYSFIFFSGLYCLYFFIIFPGVTLLIFPIHIFAFFLIHSMPFSLRCFLLSLYIYLCNYFVIVYILCSPKSFLRNYIPEYETGWIIKRQTYLRTKIDRKLWRPKPLAFWSEMTHWWLKKYIIPFITGLNVLSYLRPLWKMWRDMTTPFACC